MKKSILSSVLVTTTLLSSIPALNSGHVVHADSMSPLTTKGKEIQKDGHDYRIKGINAGNTFTTENWMGGLSDYKEAKDYKDLFDKIQSEGHSPKETHDILNKYANNKWTDEDFKNVKDMGLNTIRLPINYINVTNYKKGMDPKDVDMDSHSFEEIDNFVEKAKEHGLYVIIDLHGAPYSQNGEEHSADSNHGNKDNGKSWDGHFWDTDDQDASTSKKVADAQGKTKEILHNIAKHYKDEDAIAGYDVLNEPKGKSTASHKPEPDPQINQFYKDAVKSIRDSGDKHIIFLEGIWDPDNLKKPSYYKDTAHNLVYEYHNYPTKENDSVKQSFDEKFKKIQEKDYNVPSYMGEFNTRSMDKKPKTQKGDLAYILNQMKNKHLSWSLWNYDTQLDNNHLNKDWSPIHYSGLKIDGDNIGEKENVTRDDAVYDALKNNS